MRTTRDVLLLSAIEKIHLVHISLLQDIRERTFLTRREPAFHYHFPFVVPSSSPLVVLSACLSWTASAGAPGQRCIRLCESPN